MREKKEKYNEEKYKGTKKAYKKGNKKPRLR